MRKLLFILLFLPMVGFGQEKKVPDNATFDLDTVIGVILPSSNNLQECFNDSYDECFDFNYKDTKNSLLNFRNYCQRPSGLIYTYLTTTITVNGYPLVNISASYDSAYKYCQLNSIYGNSSTGGVPGEYESLTVGKKVYSRQTGNIYNCRTIWDMYFYNAEINKIVQVTNGYIISITTCP